jgi:hypothetical protein
MDNGSTWNPSTDMYLAWDNAAIDRPIAGDRNSMVLSKLGCIDPELDSILKWIMAVLGLLQPINIWVGIMPLGIYRLQVTLYNNINHHLFL